MDQSLLSAILRKRSTLRNCLPLEVTSEAGGAEIAGRHLYDGNETENQASMSLLVHIGVVLFTSSFLRNLQTAVQRS